MMNKLILIDGNSLINRAFYAMPFLTSNKGEHTGAVFGFANMLLKAIEKVQPQHIVVAFDVSRKTFRSELYSEYKATRKETPEELRGQFALAKNMLDCMNIARIEQQGIEADDIIGTLAKQYNGHSYIFTGDRDALQLINENTTVMFTKKGITEIEEYNYLNLKQKYGVNPDQVIDLKALMGDKSDNIPGLSGIGPKKANELLEKYYSVDNIYKNLNELVGVTKQKFEENEDIVMLSKTLATIKTDCNLKFDFEQAVLQMPFEDCLKDFFEEMNFEAFLKRKHLFKDHNKIKIPKQEIKTTQDLQTLIEGIKKTKQFAFCLTNEISFCFDNTNFVLPKEMDMFSINLTPQYCLEVLKPYFQDPAITKCTYDLKSQLSIIEKNNININTDNLYDCSILNYLIFAGIKAKEKQQTAGDVLQSLQEYKQRLKELDLQKLYLDIELPLTFVLYDMEKTGFKVDKAELDKIKQYLEEKIENIKQQIFALAEGEFNINSPKQVADVLFDKLHMKSYLDKKRSTNMDVLNELADKHPIIPLIINHRKLYKLYSTYVVPYTQIIMSQGEIIKSIFNQTLTSTGRLSSSEPNLQNIPVRDDEGKTLRKMFISRFEDGVIMSADYNQIELRLLADFSSDENLMYCFNNNIDIHTKTASEIFGVDLTNVTPKMRRDAKEVNFGIIYGMSDFGLASSLKVSLKLAKDYKQKYFNSYPKVKQYQQNNIEIAKNTGMTKTLYNRIRRIPELSSYNYSTKQFGERVAINAPLQGSASDIIKLAMIKVYQKLNKLNLKSKLILQIHDELILDVVKDEIDICKSLLKECMENVIKLKVKLPVNVTYGKSWYEC